jgi:methyl-accepting chemotaxis protein
MRADTRPTYADPYTDAPNRYAAEADPLPDGGEETVSEALAGEARALRSLGDLVGVQLDLVRNDTEQAALQILELLAPVEDLVGSFAQKVTASAGPVEQVIGQMHAELAGHSEMFEASARMNATLSQDTRGAVVQVTTLVTTLVRELDQIDDITRTTRILSLNAKIEASRAGKAGLGFGVIADEVRALSGQTEAIARSIESGVRQIEATVKGVLSRSVEERNRQDTLARERMAAATASMTEALKEMSRQQAEMLRRVAELGADLAAPIQSIAGCVQFQDIVRQQTELLEAGIRSVAEAAADLLADPRHTNGGEISAIIDELYNSYVMASQRDAHTGTEEEGGGATIELF